MLPAIPLQVVPGLMLFLMTIGFMIVVMLELAYIQKHTNRTADAVERLSEQLETSSAVDTEE